MTNAALSTALTNRRQHRRRAVLMKGQLFRGTESVDCVVINVSISGARISLVGGAAIDPAANDQPTALRIDRYGVFRGELMWRDGGSFGVRFLERPAAMHVVLSPTLPGAAFA